MKDFVNRMIDEHAKLVLNTSKLHDYIYSNNSDKDDKVEFANKCIQLSAMKKYEEALRARLENQGVFYENNQYFERIGNVKSTLNSDFEKLKDCNNSNE